ncbi:MAG: hypothetical protein ED559_11465 [Phycisphaera sp.]|nr:MAG: hypothetical protein ED559_11465 [Phycisphaera sp.]
MVKLYFIFVLVAMTAIIVASRWLPIWGACMVIPASLLFFLWFGLAVIRSWTRVLYKASLEDQSIVLRGASVVVHSVETCEAPEELQGLEEEDESNPYIPTRFVRVEMSVHPDPESEIHSRESVEEMGGRWFAHGFTLAEPSAEGELEKPDAFALLKRVPAMVYEAERVDGEPAEPDDDDNLVIEGPARIRLLFGVPSGLPDELAIRYQLLEFSRITLPPADAVQRLT